MILFIKGESEVVIVLNSVYMVMFSGGVLVDVDIVRIKYWVGMYISLKLIEEQRLG